MLDMTSLLTVTVIGNGLDVLALATKLCEKLPRYLRVLQGMDELDLPGNIFPITKDGHRITRLPTCMHPRG